MKINRTRERILDKSIELFNRKQASNVSTVQISTALEISPGNLYYYYTNKEEVIRCTWKERMVPEITEILETAEEINDKKDLEQYLKKFLAHYAKFRFFYTERTTMFYNDDEMEDLYVETAAQEKETLEAVFTFCGRYSGISARRLVSNGSATSPGFTTDGCFFTGSSFPKGTVWIISLVVRALWTVS